MSAEALAATKWQDRREAWESVTDSTDAETLVTRLSKETNGAVLDAALDAVARVASPDLAPALPHVVQKGLANARGATGRRGLRAIVALQNVAPDATTDALVDGITTSKNARGPSACAKALTTECAPSKAWLSANAERLAIAVAKLASAASGDARKAAVDLAVSVNNSVVDAKLPENAKKAVAKARGAAPPPPPPETGPPPPPGSPPKRVTIKAPPRKEPSPEKEAGSLLDALARRGVSPPYDAAFQGKWDARREKLEAVASVAKGCSGDGEALALAVAGACEAEPHAAVAKAAISACASVAGVAGVVGRRALVVALLPRLRDAKLASHAQQALNDVSQIQPEVVFDDATVRAATDALAAGAKRRLPPQGRACGFRWASSAFAASSKAPPLSTKAWAALCAADCCDAHGPLRAAARDALGAHAGHPREGRHAHEHAQREPARLERVKLREQPEDEHALQRAEDGHGDVVGGDDDGGVVVGHAEEDGDHHAHLAAKRQQEEQPPRALPHQRPQVVVEALEKVSWGPEGPLEEPGEAGGPSGARCLHEGPGPGKLDI